MVKIEELKYEHEKQMEMLNVKLDRAVEALKIKSSKAVEAVVGDKCMMLIECFDGIATERSSFS
jgi:hypothetical protein